MKVVYVEVFKEYKLKIKFDNDEVKIFDVVPYISGNWYGKLRDREYFKSVHIAGRTIEWQGGQDIAPHELYELSIPYVMENIYDG